MPEYPDRIEESEVSTDSLWDARGDLAVGIADDQAVRLPVGSNGQVLAVNNGTSTGLNWTTPSGGSGGSDVYEQPNDPGAVTVGSLWIETDVIVGYGPMWQQMTQANYDALPAKEPSTLYIIVG